MLSGAPALQASTLLHFSSRARQELCKDMLVCNSFTSWTEEEDRKWLVALGFDPLDGAAATTFGSEGPDEEGLHFKLQRPDSGLDSSWIGAGTAQGAADDAADRARSPPPPSATADHAGHDVARSIGGREGVAGEVASADGAAASRPPVGCSGPPGDPLSPSCASGYSDDYRDLRGVRVVVVVFSGRGSRLRILLPYLRRDLRESGGVVDRIIFALIRPDKAALELIDAMRRRHADSIEIRDYTSERWGEAGGDPSQRRMTMLYTSLNETDTYYIKVDDDIVYVARHAIAELVREKMRGRCLFVSANIVNHAILSAVHQERGAHRGYEPPAEFEQDPSSPQPWVRKSDVNFDPSFVFERHPMSSCVLRRWDCAAIAHESFLERQREGSLCAFDFGWLDFNRAGYREHNYVHLSPWIGQTWESTGARWSINFFVFQAKDMQGVNWARVYGPGDDEEEFGGAHGERRDSHACALGRSIVVHFSYNTQEERLTSFTDLLDRYAKLAAEGDVRDYALG